MAWSGFVPRLRLFNPVLVSAFQITFELGGIGVLLSREMERLSTSLLRNSLGVERRGEEVVFNMQKTLNFPSASGGFSCIIFLTANEN